MRRPPACAGILAASGPARSFDLKAFESAHLQLVRLRAQVNPPEDVDKWRDAGATAFVLQLLSPLPAQQPTTPRAFVEAFADDVAAFAAHGVHDLEIHDEPNRADRGAGISWQDGGTFAAWFLEVKQLLRERLGEAVAVGFPALAFSGQARPEPAAPMDEAAFLKGCKAALAEADWAALHLYWATRDEMRGHGDTMRFLRAYLEPFATQTFIVTEFANVTPGLAADARGAQYVEFLTLLAQYDRIAGSCAFLLHSDAPRYAPLAWLEPDGSPRPVVSAVGNRPKLPDPLRLQMTWPTEFRRYDQYFGENQKAYYDGCGMTGGHNGVDLRVDCASPETSPIQAALEGTVIQVSFDAKGYGHHLRVRSYGPEGEEITLIYAHLSAVAVTVGTLVRRGDVLGMAGSTGAGAGPHLHLGMRVQGIQMRAVFDWLNPRPYLDAAARGLPREPDAAAYVLLPPDALRSTLAAF
jgi:murein DD-endopeptidase MepM/ murein hydrolase activator NlpD